MLESLIVAMIYHAQADVAQVVAHLIGSEEVTGPSPVISFIWKVPETLIDAGYPVLFRFVCWFYNWSKRTEAAWNSLKE